jgi:hypothetical protein
MMKTHEKLATLPEEFKFKALDDLKANVKFILALVSQGFQLPTDRDEFLSRYVLSGDVYAYVIEDRVISVLMRNFNESAYECDDTPEVLISDFDVDFEIPQESLNLVNSKTLIDDTIKTLSRVNPSKISTKDANDIECFRLSLNHMQKHA